MNNMEAIIALVLNAWKIQASAITEYFSKHPDGFYQQPVAPGRNRAIHLLGHLIANVDGLNPLLGFGEKLFPQLDAYLSPNTSWERNDFPALPELKRQWEQVTRQLEREYSSLSPEEWLSRHTKVSEADFAIDPKRNKLNVLIGRINHMSYHLGQLNLLK